MKVKIRELNKMSDAASILKDKTVYRGFVNSEADDGIDTFDFGETLVMLAPTGTFYGWSRGVSVEETIDEQALDALVAEWESSGKERLLDIDHRSMRDVDERDTTAAGWIYDLVAVKGLGDMSGLYGKIRWTDVGRDLIQTRKYRFISPVFDLDETGRPIKLVNAAVTNRPAMTTIKPILNSEVAQGDPNKEYIDMTKEEIKDLVKSLVREALDEKTEVQNSEPEKKEIPVIDIDKPAEEAKAEEKVENSESTAPVEEKKEEPKAEEAKAENSCSEEKKEEAENACAEEAKVENAEEAKAEEPKAEEKKEEAKEVIDAKVLNSSSNPIGTSVNGMEAWRQLKGEAFFKWLREHPEAR